MKEKKVISHIVNWLENYLAESTTKGFVIGISGGIDSAVTSVLGAETGMPILCVEMPIHQSSSQMQRARSHINWLKESYKNVSSVEAELTPLFDSFISLMPKGERKENTELALINTRARIRMTTLYYFAQLNNYLVLGTGNKVEDFGIGFFTKYGDGGVDLSPIADLKKTEVFLLGKHLGIITKILSAPPTDGLWNDDKTDEQQIGATYPELEWAMEFTGDDKKISKREKAVLEIYKKMRNTNMHKMKEIPICIIPNNLK
ncbi:MAG: NAD(+) synthase [Flavobacteriales bacterium]|nr:NAD(+) synthase [Flavobacteriales bacterium]